MEKRPSTTDDGPPLITRSRLWPSTHGRSSFVLVFIDPVAHQHAWRTNVKNRPRMCIVTAMETKKGTIAVAMVPFFVVGKIYLTSATRLRSAAINMGKTCLDTNSATLGSARVAETSAGKNGPARVRSRCMVGES